MTFDSARTRHRDLRGHQSTRSATRLHTIGPRLGASQDGRDGRADGILQTPVLEGLPLASLSRCEQELSRYMAIWHESHVLSRTAALINRMNQQTITPKNALTLSLPDLRPQSTSEERERGTPKRDAGADPRLAPPPGAAQTRQPRGADTPPRARRLSAIFHMPCSRTSRPQLLLGRRAEPRAQTARSHQRFTRFGRAASRCQRRKWARASRCSSWCS